MNNENKTTKTKTYGSPVVASGFWVGVALMMIFFWGEPDLNDALIAFLMDRGYN